MSSDVYVARDGRSLCNKVEIRVRELDWRPSHDRDDNNDLYQQREKFQLCVASPRLLEKINRHANYMQIRRIGTTSYMGWHDAG